MRILGLVIMMVLLSAVTNASVPKPYTPVKVSAREIKVLGRTMTFGPMLLPAQMKAAGENLLISPVRVVAEPASVMEGLTGSGKVVSNNGDSAVLEYKGESSAFDIEVRITADCDGFCWYDVTLTPKQPVELSSLRLEIPRRAETARYIHTASFTWGQGLSQGVEGLGKEWAGKWMPYVWLGDEERGLAWCCESDEGWNLKDPSKSLGISASGDVLLFTVTLLDHPETIRAPIKLRFGLQATPVKRVSFEWRAKARIYHGVNLSSIEPDEDGKIPLDLLRDAGVKTVVFHDMWPEYYGQLVPSDPETFRKLVDECHKRGLRLLVYIGYGVAKNAPEIQGHHDEWSAMPLILWDPSYRPEYRAFDACCPRSGWADWLVQGIDKLFTDYGLDGIYFDGTSEAWRCENESHGCGWRDKDGNLHTNHPVLAARSLMRRIADTVRRHNPDAMLDAHMSDNLTMPTLSFCDSYWDGEQYEVYKAADKVEIPLDAFRTEFMGYAHGLDAEFLCYENRPFTFDESIAVSWLHGVEVRPGNTEQLKHVVPIWSALDRFGAPSAKWLPYWKGSGVSCADPSVKASPFVKDGKALIFVSHLKREPLSTTLVLDPKTLGLPSGDLTATDAIAGQPLDTQGLSIPMDFEGMTWRLIEIQKAPCP